MAKNPITDGTHEDHVRAGEQSHKNTGSAAKASDSSTQGGTQHVKAGEQSHKNTGGMAAKDGAHTSGGQGGTHEQHVKAGQQSHKNS